MKILFEKEKETKNTIRFREISSPERIPTIYIQKEALTAIDWQEDEHIEIEIRKMIK